MVKYQFKTGEPLTFKSSDKANAQRLGEALADITSRHGGHLVPAAVVDAARDKKNPLNPHFEWNDSIAAGKFRIDQARSLIRCIHVVSEESESGTMRAFISIADKGGVSYRSAASVLSSADLQQKALAAAERDLLAFETRYKNLEEVCDLIREARARIARRLKEVSATHPTT